MKFFYFLLYFIVIFLIFQYAAVEYFTNLNAIRTLFSLTIAAVLTATGMGIADMLKADDPEEEEA